MTDTLVFAIGSFVTTLCVLTVALLAWAALRGEDDGQKT